jgi:long-chain acyl-CoA synthetase
VNFLENILDRLARQPQAVVIEELRASGNATATAAELLSRVSAARAALAAAGLRKGDRCVVLAPNGIAWAALDLAAMCEGIIVVPLYTRQAANELVAMMRDAQPSLICYGDVALRDAVRAAWPDAPPGLLIEEVFAARQGAAPASAPVRLADGDIVKIIYTSGTSGEAKGVMLTAANVTYMISCTTARLDLLMGPRDVPDNVFHYLPFCFAGSWILLLSCLSRSSRLQLCTDLTRLAEDLRAAQPDYCQNVPLLLERMRTAIEGQLKSRGGLIERIFRNAQAAYIAQHNDAGTGGSGAGGGLSLAVGRVLIFPTIRKKLGPKLKALICGSAPLAKETQLFFMMLGIPVLQSYGLTETTAICTMDDPRKVDPGTVGPAITGIEMKLGEGDEILVRGPNVFAGYWMRPQETAKAMTGDWFHTGDRGEQTADGYWRIIGRLKNLLILSSGHNVAPEPLEEKLVHAIARAQQVVVFGHGRSHLVALVTGNVERAKADESIATLNATLPHYDQIRACHIELQPLTIESGLLTANGKLRRDAIAARFREEIAGMYRKGDAAQEARAAAQP